jgi:hypothetical protein
LSKREGRELFAELEAGNMLDYGNFIPARIVRDCIGLDYPEVATKREFDQLGLREMAAIDYVRNILLGIGKYISAVSGGYRILTISENVEQVEQYMSSADRKLSRGLKLLKNTPRERGSYPDQAEARMELKREAVSRHRKRHITPPPV